MFKRVKLCTTVVVVALAGFVYCRLAMAEIVTFQQGALIPTQAGGNGTDTYAGTADLHLRQDAYNGLTANTGGEKWLVIGQWGNGGENDNTRILIDFNSYGTLGNYIQSNNLSIQSVKLKLYLSGIAGDSTTIGHTIDAFKAASTFNEGTGASNGRDGSLASTGQSCWNYQSYNTVGWAGGGAHGASDWGIHLDAESLTQPSGGSWTYSWLVEYSQPTEVVLDVTGAFASDGSDLNDAHKGIVILARVDNANPYQDDTSGGRQFLFNSRNSTGGYHPVLEFTIVPEPSSMILSVIGLIGLLACGWRRNR